LAVSPVPEDKLLEALMEERRDQLTDEQRADPSFAADSDMWPTLFDDERQAALNYFVGSYPPSRHNRRERRQWWYVPTIKLVLAYNGYVHPTPRSAPRIFGGATSHSSSSCTHMSPPGPCLQGSSWHGRSARAVTFWQPKPETRMSPRYGGATFRQPKTEVHSPPRYGGVAF
jgi:hypothetical protein